MPLVVNGIMVGRDQADVRTDIGEIADFHAVFGVDIHTRTVTGIHRPAAFDPFRISDGTGEMHRPGYGRIETKDFLKKLILQAETQTDIGGKAEQPFDQPETRGGRGAWPGRGNLIGSLFFRHRPK